MNIRITKDKKIETEMEGQLMKTVEAVGEAVEEEMTSPAQHHHFYVNDDSKILDKNKKGIFHSVIAKHLHIVKQGRPDLERLVSFLTMRVTKNQCR